MAIFLSNHTKEMNHFSDHRNLSKLTNNLSNHHNNDNKNVTEDIQESLIEAASNENILVNNQSQQLSLEQIICEDLHSFENRLVEIIQNFETKNKRWRLIFILCLLLTIITAILWLKDAETVKCSLWQSLYNHYLFTISCLILISLLFYGIHKRVTQQDIIVNRIRYVLGQFNMGCDNQGRLILKPTPASFRFQNNENNKQPKNNILTGNDHLESPPSSSLNLLHSPLYGSNGFR